MMTDETSRVPRLAVAEAVAALALLGLAFAAIAASDVSATGTHGYWLGLVVLYAVAAFASDRLHSGRGFAHLGSALTIALHWAGVLAALELVQVFVGAGRLANADTGLTSGLILALGAFTAGTAGNWRFMVVGVALGAATIGVAVVEEYLWVLLGIAVLAVVIMILGGRLRRQHRATADG